MAIGSIKRLARRLLGLTRLDGRIDELAGCVHELSRISYAPARGQWACVHDNFYEPNVNLALRDLCRPGMVAFDCGANIGMLSLLMSRLVGPRGIVCAFEASPRNAEMCLNNLVANGCPNVSLHQRALSDASGRTLPLFVRDNGQADGIVPGVNEQPAGEALSLALDDFVDASGLIPDVVKMDIEGAEFDAIRGFGRTLDQHRPHLIAETTTDDARVLMAMRERGYRAIDLSTYREITTPADFPHGAVLRSLLYIHRERIAGTPYALPVEDQTLYRLSARDFAISAGGRIESAAAIELEPGRYVAEVEASALHDKPIACGVLTARGPLVDHRASAGWIASSYREWVFDLARPERITLFAAPAEHIRVEGAVIRRIVPLSKTGAWRVLV